MLNTLFKITTCTSGVFVTIQLYSSSLSVNGYFEISSFILFVRALRHNYHISCFNRFVFLYLCLSTKLKNIKKVDFSIFFNINCNHVSFTWRNKRIRKIYLLKYTTLMDLKWANIIRFLYKS